MAGSEALNILSCATMMRSSTPFSRASAATTPGSEAASSAPNTSAYAATSAGVLDSISKCTVTKVHSSGPPSNARTRRSASQSHVSTSLLYATNPPAVAASASSFRL